MTNTNIKRWAVADCETDAFDGQNCAPFIWAYLTDDGERDIFWSTADFLEWVRGFDGIIYGHNAGRFDWLMPDIAAAFEEGEIKIINGRVAKAKIGKAEMRDSFLCLPAALEKFGDKDDFDYKILERACADTRATENRAVIEKYISQDCVALFNAMSAFIAINGHALTQAGAALKTWEAMGGEKRRYGKNHYDAFAEYYIGGRCQVFEYCDDTRGDFVMYDINSSYPAAMMREHCIGKEYTATTDYKNATSSFWTITAVSRGMLAYRDARGAVTYPNDDTAREYKTTGWEITAAIDCGALDIIKARGLVPRRVASFAPYIERFFAERAACKAQGDEIGSLLAKLKMNSLYGKYGANPETYKTYKIATKGKRPDGWTLSQSCDEHDILERPAGAPQYFDVAVAASITGYARSVLARAIHAGERVIYCDTDSVLCEEFGGVVGDKLGEWSCDGEFDALWIAGKKCYALKRKNEDEYKIAHKGVSRLDTTIDHVKRAAHGEIVEIMKSAPTCTLSGAQKFISRKIKIT